MEDMEKSLDDFFDEVEKEEKPEEVKKPRVHISKSVCESCEG